MNLKKKSKERLILFFVLLLAALACLSLGFTRAFAMSGLARWTGKPSPT